VCNIIVICREIILNRQRLTPRTVALMALLAALPGLSLIPTASAQAAEADSAQATALAPALAYATRDPNGVWSFSDIPDPAARQIVLPQSESVAPSSDELIAQMLDVAAILETARLAREDRRTTQATAPKTLEQPPAVVTEQHVFSPYGYPPQPHRNRPQPTPEPPVKEPQRKNQKIRFPVDF
jgi:hypothetical protein